MQADARRRPAIYGGIVVKNEDKVVVLDFGGQYKELIARTVRELGVYSEILPGNTTASRLKEIAPKAIILTGGPYSVYDETSPKMDAEVLQLGIPVLGICYGMQLVCHTLGGRVEAAETGEYGTVRTTVVKDSLLFKEVIAGDVLMSHSDRVVRLPEGFVVTSQTAHCPIASAENVDKNIYLVQFHPEVNRTRYGKKMIANFLFAVSGAKKGYSVRKVLQRQQQLIRSRVGNDTVILGLSGGVDSSVTAAVLEKAVPGQVVCIFVDHGLMRKNEGDEIEQAFKGKNLRFVRVNAQQRFLEKLKGVTDPERKRKIIGAEFVKVFEEESSKYGECFLAQGTIYPDVIESGANNSAVIKSHHNVGGLPKETRFKGIVEPLRGFFKDEVRKLGRMLDLPAKLVNRQPFPGPGLAVRCIGEITEEKLEILREADYIFNTELAAAKVHSDQSFCVLTPIKTVGVMGDYRTYDYVVALRAVLTNDFMTCEAQEIPYKVVRKVTSRIVNEVKGISRVVLDVTGKPPATIEWE